MIFKYLYLKSNFKIIIISALFILIYNFLIFLEFIKKNSDYNFYDILDRQFSYNTIFYAITLTFLLIIYSMSDIKKYNKNIFLKLINKSNIYIIDVINIVTISICMFFYLIILTLAECLINIDFSNKWSYYFIVNSTNKENLSIDPNFVEYIINNLSPLKYYTYISILIILYLIFTGVLFLVLENLFNNRVIALLTTLLILFLSRFIENGVTSKIAFMKNIYFITSSYDEITNHFYFISRIIYWCTLTVILFLLGNKLSKKREYKI